MVSTRNVVPSSLMADARQLHAQELPRTPHAPFFGIASQDINQKTLFRPLQGNFRYSSSSASKHGKCKELIHHNKTSCAPSRSEAPVLKVLQHSYITVENWHTNSNRNSSGAICQGPDFVSDSFEHHESTSAQGQATLAKRQNSEVEKRGSTKATARCRSRNKFRDYSIGCSAALIR
jgi:hypothetical protein